MKLFILFSLLILSTISIKKHHHKLNKRKTKKTPQGFELNNHFGYHPLASPYGPTNQIIGNNQIPVQNDCNLEIVPNYQICSSLLSCNDCSNSPVCGWCGNSNKCFPGTKTSCSCPGMCSQTWTFENNLCLSNPTNIIYNKPRVRVITKEPRVVNRPVYLGKTAVNHKISMVDYETGETSTHTIHQEKPIIQNQARIENVYRERII